MSTFFLILTHSLFSCTALTVRKSQISRAFGLFLKSAPFSIYFLLEKSWISNYSSITSKIQISDRILDFFPYQDAKTPPTLAKYFSRRIFCYQPENCQQKDQNSEATVQIRQKILFWTPKHVHCTHTVCISFTYLSCYISDWTK